MRTLFHVWVRRNVPKDCAGRCEEFAFAMAKAFRSLTVRYGHYVHSYGTAEVHFWCEDADGSVVDPTASQFPPGGSYRRGRIGGRLVRALCAKCHGPLFEDGLGTCPDGCENNPFHQEMQWTQLQRRRQSRLDTDHS